MNEHIQQNVLLADDEPAIRVYVATILRREGFHVFEAADGLAALASLREIDGAVDILITDIEMPRMTGDKLAEAVKADLPHVPVVYISGRHFEQQLHDPEHRTVFLQKPFRPQALLDAVRSVCTTGLPACPQPVST